MACWRLAASIKRPRPRLSGCIEPPAYAAMQKKVWLRKKNAYLMLARVGVTLGPASVSWL